jgi:LytS/YehU family sensor histidine kinase
MSLSVGTKMEYAELLMYANQLDSALYYYNKFDSANAEIKDLRYFLISKGEYYLFLKQYKTALPYFQKGLIYHMQLDDRIQVKRALLDIAKTYAALQKNDSAISYAPQGLTIALKAKSTRSIRDAYEILYSVYDRLHKSDSAYYYYHSYITTKEAVMNNQTMGKMAAYNYEHTIASLEEKIVQQQRLQQELLQKKILAGSVIALLLIGAIVFRIIVLKRKNEKLRLENELHIQQLETERTKSELQRQAAELEMQALRAQMNPHFIFNSLNSINMFILENNKLQASEYLSKFSRLIRLILQNSKEAFISLESELEALQLYLELESLRFDNKFEYKISVDEDIDTTTLKVPPLVIQPYAENAIWHGLMHKKERGYLEIELSQEDKILFCKITDDGVGRKKAAELKSKSSTHRSMGIRITEDRITMLQREQEKNFISITDLVFPDGTSAGTEVLIKIPLHYD